MQPGETANLDTQLMEDAHAYLKKAEELGCKMDLLTWNFICLSRIPEAGAHITTWKIRDPSIPEDSTLEELPEPYKIFINDFWDSDNPPFKRVVEFEAGWDRPGEHRDSLLILAAFYYF